MKVERSPLTSTTAGKATSVLRQGLTWTARCHACGWRRSGWTTDVAATTALRIHRQHQCLTTEVSDG